MTLQDLSYIQTYLNDFKDPGEYIITTFKDNKDLFEVVFVTFSGKCFGSHFSCKMLDPASGDKERALIIRRKLFGLHESEINITQRRLKSAMDKLVR